MPRTSGSETSNLEDAPPSIPADGPLLRVSVLQPGLKRGGQNQRELVVYAGEQGEWPAQAPILSIMVGPFLPGENLPCAACQCNLVSSLCLFGNAIGSD